MVRALPASCADCAREHAGLAPLPALLEVAGPAEVVPAKPPPALEDVVVDSFARGRRPVPPRRVRRWLARPLPVAAAAAATAALITLLISSGLGGSTSPARTYSALLQGSAAAPGARAYAKLASVASGTRVQLDVSGVRPQPVCLQPGALRTVGSALSAGTCVDVRRAGPTSGSPPRRAWASTTA